MEQFNYDLYRATSGWYCLLETCALLSGIFCSRIIAYFANGRTRVFYLVTCVMGAGLLIGVAATWFSGIKLDVSQQTGRDVLTTFTIGFAIGAIFRKSSWTHNR